MCLAEPTGAAGPAGADQQPGLAASPAGTTEVGPAEPAGAAGAAGADEEAGVAARAASPAGAGTRPTGATGAGDTLEETGAATSPTDPALGARPPDTADAAIAEPSAGPACPAGRAGNDA